MKRFIIIAFLLVILSGVSNAQYDKTQTQIKDYIYLKFRPTVTKWEGSGITLYTVLNYLNENKCHVPCAEGNGLDSLYVDYSCLGGTSGYLVSGDTIFVDTCGGTGLTPAAPDSIYVDYACLSGIDGWLFSGDTLFIDTCYADITDSSFLARDAVNGELYPKTLTDQFGIGTADPTEMLDVNGNINIPVTSSTVGKLKINSVPVFHTYHEMGDNNLFIGQNAGNTSADSSFNIGLGANALTSLTSGHSNIAIGHNALTFLTNGWQNTVMGWSAAINMVNGQRNTAMGRSALQEGVGSYDNTAIGWCSMTGKIAKSQGYNTAVGGYSLFNIGDNGDNNTAVGYGALYNNVGRKNSTAIGFKAMYNTSDGTANTITYNTAVGYEAMKGSVTPTNNTGQYNTVVGYGSMASFSTAYKNFAGGYNAFTTGTTGYNNTFVGAESGDGMTTGHDNSAVGYNSMSVSSGAVGAYNNTTFGTDAGVWTGYTPYQNVAFGGSSGGTMNGSNATYQSYNNTFIGYGSGSQAANNTTSMIRDNIFIGFYAGRRAGAGAGLNPTFNIAIGELAFGDYDGAHNTNGDHNIAIGNWTLQNAAGADSNIVIGDSTGYSLTTGNNNIYIGVGVGKSQTTESNKIRIGQDDLIEGDVSTNVVTFNDFIKLNPVSSPPGTPEEGQIYYDIDDHHFYGYNGTIWVQLD